MRRFQTITPVSRILTTYMNMYTSGELEVNMSVLYRFSKFGVIPADLRTSGVRLQTAKGQSHLQHVIKVCMASD